MKLLTRTSLLYFAASTVVFVVSGLIFYQILTQIFLRQIDNTLKEEKLLIEQTINYSDSVPDFRLIFGHLIDVTILNEPLPKAGYIRDTLMYDQDLGSFASFRYLLAENTSFRNKGYIINLYKPMSETETLITEILLSFALVFLSLMAVLVLANYWITRRIWIPFYKTLGQLVHYDISRASPISLTPSGIHEFNQLNEAVEKMSEKIRRDFMNVKEFNENAAHELQTPLAVIKSKLDLLIQDDNLPERMANLAVGMSEATTRMSRMIQELLLISKIENNQFPETSDVDVRQLLCRVTGHFTELIEHKSIRLETVCSSSPVVRMNPALAEILMTNLVSNAIRHNYGGGSIRALLSDHELSVSNTGPPPKIHPSELFLKFKKSSDHPESTGLGLVIIRKICDQHKMDVRYSYSEPWHRFDILFPGYATELQQNPASLL